MFPYLFLFGQPECRSINGKQTKTIPWTQPRLTIKSFDVRNGTESTRFTFDLHHSFEGQYSVKKILVCNGKWLLVFVRDIRVTRLWESGGVYVF